MAKKKEEKAVEETLVAEQPRVKRRRTLPIPLEVSVPSGVALASAPVTTVEDEFGLVYQVDGDRIVATHEGPAMFRTWVGASAWEHVLDVGDHWVYAEVR